ncbi:hypothetical protein SEMRO_855_G211330.1 [Seminavis robusta]|uniref:Uncharacterized protein n=1 Tax=Seminavis robusta TaxID=568900 RepID=A0A9N8EDX7_9STRA|nr:hypothetical protein SEMRO_855_G211330.1 [Seminavis robusta]|eukprot:Sro855_g211330.1 n/a (109) ;mRNA; r:5546-5872
MDYESTGSEGSDNNTALADCFKQDGSIDIAKYSHYAREQDALDDKEDNYLLGMGNIASEDDEEGTTAAATAATGGSRKRRVKSLKPYFFDEEGKKVTLAPRQTFWYMM